MLGGSSKERNSGASSTFQVCPPTRLSAHLSARASVRPPICLTVCLPVCTERPDGWNLIGPAKAPKQNLAKAPKQNSAKAPKKRKRGGVQCHKVTERDVERVHLSALPSGLRGLFVVVLPLDAGIGGLEDMQENFDGLTAGHGLAVYLGATAAAAIGRDKTITVASLRSQAAAQRLVQLHEPLEGKATVFVLEEEVAVADWGSVEEGLGAANGITLEMMVSPLRATDTAFKRESVPHRGTWATGGGHRMRAPSGLQQAGHQHYGYKKKATDGVRGRLAATMMAAQRLQNSAARRTHSFYAQSSLQENYEELPDDRFGKAGAVLESFQVCPPTRLSTHLSARASV